MNKEEYQKTIEDIKPPNYFSAVTLKEAYIDGFETAKELFKEIAEKDKTTHSNNQDTIQPIDLINAQDLNFNLGNVVKYVCLASKKKGENILTDLEKAKDYINFEIERVKQ